MTSPFLYSLDTRASGQSANFETDRFWMLLNQSQEDLHIQKDQYERDMSEMNHCLVEQEHRWKSKIDAQTTLYSSAFGEPFDDDSAALITSGRKTVCRK